MGTAADAKAQQISAHVDQWKHNRKFISVIPPEFSDWIVTAALYTTLHVVEALLCADEAKIRSRHQDRFAILQAERRYEKIYKCFDTLYQLAHVTRYSANPKRWIPADKIDSKIIKELVYPIEQSARGLLAKSSPPYALPDLGPILLSAGPS